ncbi:hypothetical protein [Streptomyces sp. WAC00263]|uniref:hypothetical protein n=1 Tax=Streptomyces sp. WAC00263 TaxID=1917422 RepID=UPI001F50705F|nr:hypothetical protein [Streptomyces sp. WAC00263]
MPELLSIAAEKRSLRGSSWDWVGGIRLNGVGHAVVLLRTWELPTSIPNGRAAAANVSSVHSDGPDSSAAHRSPLSRTSGLPGGPS